jgi:hypothetical protein
MKGTAHECLKAIYSLKPQSLATSVNKGSGVDCKGFDEALIVIPAGTVTSNGSHVFKVQEASVDTDNQYADIAGAAFTAITAGNDDTCYVGRLNLRGCKRFIRVVDTGSTQAMLGAAVVVLAGARIEPVTQENAAAFSL